jgi:hypothetical protein
MLPIHQDCVTDIGFAGGLALTHAVELALPAS